jgi:hypothetical protein
LTQFNLQSPGFSIVRNGAKLRVKSGDSDSGTTIDEGQPIEQELSLLSQSYISPDGKRVYKLGDELYNEDQVGENIIFEIFGRYTGVPLDRDDELLFNTSFAGFEILPSTPEPVGDSPSAEWLGEYILGDGYSKSLRGTKGKFMLKIAVSQGEVKGACYDDDKREGEPATINGIVYDDFIWFIKRYPITYVIDDQGNSYPDKSRPPNQIAYTGLYDSTTQSYRGVWHIENKPNWGEWNMRQTEKAP